MSGLKNIIKNIGTHLKDTGKDIQKFPDDIKDSIRNGILRQPQTLRDYNITSTLTQKELIDTLSGFHYSLLNDTKNGIARQLLLTMDRKNFPINVEKIENLYHTFSEIEDSTLTPEEKKTKKDEILANLSNQDIFSLQLYNYNSNFRNTHIKDGNKLKDLSLYRPHIPRPSKPDNQPQKPQKSDFEYKEDYENAQKSWNKETKQWKRTQEYKKWDERTEKTEWMKDILKAVLDMGPLNRLSNGIIKRISAILERGGGAGVQHTLETVFHPNILKMSPGEEEQLRHILIDVKYGKKYFIVLNHETFANIPITIVKFMQVASEIGIENVNEYFTTIIGPLLATHKKQNALLNSLSSILVTHPADNKIPGAKRIANHQQHNALSQFEKDLNKDNPRGQIYFCAPSGTRDIIHYSDDGIPQIFIPDESRGSNITTTRLIKNLHAQNPNMKVYAISTNTTELKKPNKEKGVSPNNNKRNKNASILLHLQEVDMQNFNTNTLLSTILKGICHPIPPKESQKSIKTNKGKIQYDYDENGKINEIQCAQSLPSDIFKYLKKFTKTEEYARTGQLPQRFFNQDGQLDLEKVKLEIEKSKTN